MTAVTTSRAALAEIRALLWLAAPIIIAQLSHTAIGFVDTVMAGRVSPSDLAAVALGNSIWVPILLFMNGVLLATTPKVAQLFGAENTDAVGPLVRQALWLAAAVGLIATATLWNAEPVLHLMKVDPELVPMAMGYLQATAVGFPAVAFYHVLRCMSDGLGRTRPSMYIGLGGLALNIPLNYIFIYGKLGLPAMGGVGCGWASAVSMWFMLLAMLAWVKMGPYYQPYKFFSQFSRPNFHEIKRLISIGLPIGIAIFAEVSIFSVIALLIGSLGAATVAGHQIALNISSLIFMVPFSLGLAVTVRVGQALGRGDPVHARFAALVGISCALAFAFISATGMMIWREALVGIYTTDPLVIAIATSLIIYAALFQFSDGIQVCAAGALRGFQDTRVTMIFTLFSYWGVGLPVGYALGISDWLGEPSGPKGLWEGLIAGLTCAAILLGARLHFTARRHIHLANSPKAKHA